MLGTISTLSVSAGPTSELHTVRTNSGIDPTLAIWNWEIPVYLFLGGLVAGIMVVGAIQQLRGNGRWERRLSLWGSAVAAGLLSLGMLALFLDLAHKAYVPRFYLAFKPMSPMSWGSWILMLAYPLLGLWFLGSLADEQTDRLTKKVPLLRLLRGVRKWSVEHQRAVLLAIAGVGIALGAYTGVLLQTLTARPLWSTGLLAPLFLLSGISGAAALMMLWKVNSGTFRDLLKWDLAALALEALVLCLFLLEKATGSAIDRMAAKLLLAGPYAGAFFGLVVLVGILAPTVLEVFELKHAGRRSILAPLLVLAGGLALPAIIVSAGQASNYSMLAGG